MMVEEIPADAAAYVQIQTALHKIENRTEDGTLLVLKGHLVLEELIREPPARPKQTKNKSVR
jgi:hypothetical protein